MFPKSTFQQSRPITVAKSDGRLFGTNFFYTTHLGRFFKGLHTRSGVRCEFLVDFFYRDGKNCCSLARRFFHPLAGKHFAGSICFCEFCFWSFFPWRWWGQPEPTRLKQSNKLQSAQHTNKPKQNMAKEFTTTADHLKRERNNSNELHGMHSEN